MKWKVKSNNITRACFFFFKQIFNFVGENSAAWKNSFSLSLFCLGVGFYEGLFIYNVGG